MAGSLEWLHEVRGGVDARLLEFFDEQERHADGIAPETKELVDALKVLTTRGGKRVRPAVLVAAFRSVAPHENWKLTIDACCALELLQSYLLIHDDWMDGDETRRGGPSVHTALATAKGDAHLGACLAVLGGDLGSAYAQQLMLGSLVGRPRAHDALHAFTRMQVEVVFGQTLDLLASPDVSRMQKLKTGSYTVDGPLRVGALLGSADAEQLAALEAFGGPLGEAFQLRDDLLGVFGDPKTTGKPAGNDLRAGKRTALVLECERLLAESERGALTNVFGVRDASDEDIAAATELLVQSGAKANVEHRLRELFEQSCAALQAENLFDPGRTMLKEIAQAIANRDK